MSDGPCEVPPEERERERLRELDELRTKKRELEAERDRLLDEKHEALEQLRRAKGENQCDACLGGNPISGKPCMCRGTGKMSEAALYLREQLVKTEARLDELRSMHHQMCEASAEWQHKLADLEIKYRERLWLNHGCPQRALYGDDGERQCSACGIDFKRRPLDELEKLISDRAEARMIAWAEENVDRMVARAKEEKG